MPAVVRCLPLAEEGRRRKGWKGRSQKKCITPSRTSAHPPWSHPTICIPTTLFRIYPTHIPLKYHWEKSTPRIAQPPSSQLAIPVFILVSLLACKCPGSSPGSHNPCSSHTFAPTTSRDLGSSVPPLCGIKCTSNCRAGSWER